MVNVRKLVNFLFIAILISSCVNKKKVIYFQGQLQNSEKFNNYDPVLKADDLISVLVLGVDEQAVKPFNLPISNTNQNIGGYTSGVQSPMGYLIDRDGNVDFPIIGKLKLGGLTRSDAVKLIKTELNSYLTNPTVIIRILNYKITVLGEVKNPGTFNIPNERISLVEALGIAGDLLISARRNNVLIIREVDGKKNQFRVDLTSTELFSSPVFYLTQNDVVYVEPNRAKINSSALNTTNVSIVISTISLIITLAVLIRK
jgi:polysaccharide export outer membrane protein